MSLYFHHDSVEQALKMSELRRLADTGDATSQYELGRFLVYDAEGGPKDKLVREGVRLLLLSADQNHVEALGTLGAIYNQGLEGVDSDSDLGMRFIGLAAAEGHHGSVQDLAYGFAYGNTKDEVPNLIEGYAYFKLSEYIADSKGFSAEISQENINALGASMDDSQLALALDRFEKLRAQLEAKPVWMASKAKEKRSSDKDRYSRLLDWHSEALVHADAYPGEHSRLKSLIDEMETVMNREDMLAIRSERQKRGLSITPVTSTNKPSFGERGCLGAGIFLIPLVLLVAAFN
jgi:hypothetical protein